MSGLPRRNPDDSTLYVEPSFTPEAVRALADAGHVIEVSAADRDDLFGSCTLVTRDGDEIVACADHRRSAAAAAW